MIPGGGHSPSHDLLQKDWDAIGAEIGTSDLDHSDDSDSEVVRFPLKPGQHERVRILFRYLDRDGAERLERNIRAYQLTLG